MKTEENKLILNEKEAEIYADLIAGVPVAQTVKRTGVSRGTVLRRRQQIRAYRKQDKTFAEIQRDAMTLVPLVYESLAYFLMTKDKEVTLKVAQGLGLLAKDNEGLKEIVTALAGAGNANPVTVNNINIQSPDELDKLDNNLASILTRTSENNRFKQN